MHVTCGSAIDAPRLAAGYFGAMLPLRPAAALAASVLLVSLGALPALASPSAAAARASAITGTSPAGVIVQMFDWPWTAIAAECTSVLGPDGYAAVQISPPQEAVVLAADGYPWWQAYQPVSYGLNSRFGTQAQLAAMITACHAAGVKVYADVVLNHMTAQVNGGVGRQRDHFRRHVRLPAAVQRGRLPQLPHVDHELGRRVAGLELRAQRPGRPGHRVALRAEPGGGLPEPPPRRWAWTASAGTPPRRWIRPTSRRSRPC